jgi:hypothetical protein
MTDDASSIHRRSSTTAPGAPIAGFMYRCRWRWAQLKSPRLLPTE